MWQIIKRYKFYLLTILFIIGVFYFYPSKNPPVLKFGAETIAYDTSTSINNTASGQGLTTNAFTVGSGTSRVLVISYGHGGSASDLSPTCTYSGTSDSITRIVSISNPSTGRVYIFLVINPQSGSQTVTCTPNANVTYRMVHVTSLSGVNQSATPDNSTTQDGGTGTSWNPGITVNTANSWIIAGSVDANGLVISAGANTVVRQTIGGGSIFDSNAARGTGSQTMTITTATSDTNIWGILSLAPASVPGGSPPLDDSTWFQILRSWIINKTYAYE